MPACAQAVRDGLVRERGVVLLAREALFLRGGDDLAVAEQAGGAVVIEGRDAEDVLVRHPNLRPWLFREHEWTDDEHVEPRPVEHADGIARVAHRWVRETR